MRALMLAAMMVAGVQANAASDDAIAPKVEPLRLVKQPLPVFPNLPDREALVILEFDVLPTGKTANIHVIEGGFHEKRFVNAAMSAVRRYVFEPRRINGQAVDTEGLTRAFRFHLKDVGPGITPEFRRELDKVGALLEKKDYAGAHFHAEWMVAEKVLFSYEYAVLQAQLAETYTRLGQNPEAIVRAYRATQRTTMLPEFLQLQAVVPTNRAADYLLPKEIVVGLLELRMRLLVKQGLYLEAMQAYYELAGLVVLEPDDPRSVVAREVTAAIKGSGTLTGIVEMGDSRSRSYYFSRHSFTLDKIEGQVQSLAIRCTGRKQAILEYKPELEWKIPASWGVCAASIGASPGTRFQVIEFPDEPAVSASP